jgi:hypothetical protein
MDSTLNPEEKPKALMPYEITFSKKFDIVDRKEYFNDCCIGGDIVLDVLLPELRKTYEDLMTNQEDWGWFAWFTDQKVNLAVDVFCDDPETGSFRIHLTSRVPNWIHGHRTKDTPELDSLRDRVLPTLANWLGIAPQTTRIETD